MSDFYLSIVATSRNDDHGGNLLERMNAFIEGALVQSKRHKLPIELIIVEWNPPEKRPPLSKALKLPKDKGKSKIRIISVPKKLHDRLDHSESIPLFQMYAKNIGISRASGKYILATNIDILFSDKLFRYFKKKKLKPDVIYRVDRLDIPPNPPMHLPFKKVLEFCKAKTFRINGRFGTKELHEKPKPAHSSLKKKLLKLLEKFDLLDWKSILPKLVSPNIFKINRWKTLIGLYIINLKRFIRKLFCLYIFEEPSKKIKRCFIKRSSFRYILSPHSNACGDFQLLSKKGWETLRGYPEWTIFSWHIDSIFLYQAIFSGFKEKNFGSKRPIYHIEHAKGSGYTPEGYAALLKRLDAKKIPYLDNEAFNKRLNKMKPSHDFSRTILYNEKEWGMNDQKLEEVLL